MQLFHRDDSEAVILVDADNAFNRVNRAAALWNVQYVCPSLKFALINTYRSPTRIFVSGKHGAVTDELEPTGRNDLIISEMT